MACLRPQTLQIVVSEFHACTGQNFLSAYVTLFENVMQILLLPLTALKFSYWQCFGSVCVCLLL